MSHLEVPRFPRGFLLADRPVEAPPTFVQGPLLQNFYVHEWTAIDTAGDDDLFVMVLGHAVPTWDTGDPQPAQRLLCALERDDEAFFRELSGYSGRHAVLFGSATHLKIVNDATGMRSVFYAGQGGVVASHALLVERALGSRPVRDRLPVQYGYPGNRTPYLRTKLLIPNTFYDVTHNTTHRFWPTASLPERSVDEVAAEALSAASFAMKHMSKDRTVKMALTAGLDSRSILAVGIHSGVPFETYTYGDANNTAVDRGFAYDLATRFDLPHTMTPRPDLSPELNRALSDATYAAHHKKVVPGLMDWFDDPHSVAVTGNLLEIGRSFYLSRRREGLAEPHDAHAMVALHYQSMSANSKRVLQDYGVERYEDVATLAFQTFIEDAQLAHSAELFDGFDQFYWEHRMAAWHGPAMAERDFYAEAFIPFNSRNIFEAMLGVPQEDRDTGSVFYRMIEMVDPELLEMPINPKTWGSVSKV